MIEIEFFGVRGSTPCSCSETAGVGGNTSCVLLRCGDDAPIILDLGTGLRYLGKRLGALASPGGGFQATALISHLHWDHVQGLPFFLPLLRDDARLEIVGPTQPTSSLTDELRAFVRPPLFPVGLDGLPATIECIEMERGSLSVGSATITVCPVQHVGPTNGYRIQNGTGSVAYLPDHQQPVDFVVPDDVIALCCDVDVLIHDAQYDDAELSAKIDWGHSSYRYAVEVAKQSGARRLVLFHHDPAHGDGWVARAVERARDLAGPDLEVTAAVEGAVIRTGSAEAVAV